MNAVPFIQRGQMLRSVLYGCRPCVRLLFLLVVLGGILPWAIAPVRGQNYIADGKSNNRFLFIVDTSSEMKHHRDDVSKSIAEILGNSASGQLHYGDTLGLWTYNDDVYAQLPIQSWAAAERDDITERITAFLKTQKPGKGSRFDKVLPNLFQVVASSDILTIFIFSNSELKLSGTPFDQAFNSTYGENLKESKRQHLPVVTVLQSKSGRLFRYTINPLPWPVVIPELPIPIKLPGAIAAKPPVAAPPAVALPVVAVVAPTNPTPPLIMSGSKMITNGVIPAAPPRLFARETGPPTNATLTVPPPPTFKPPAATNAPFNPLSVNSIVPGSQPVVNIPALPAALPAAPPTVIPESPKFLPATVALPKALATNAPVKPAPSPLPVIPTTPVATFSAGSNAGLNRRPLPLTTVSPPANNATSANMALTNKIAASDALHQMWAAAKTNDAATQTARSNAVHANISDTNATLAAKTLKERALAFIAPAGQNRSQSLLLMAAILILIALLLIVVIVRRSRATGPSLISRSLKK